MSDNATIQTNNVQSNAKNKETTSPKQLSPQPPATPSQTETTANNKNTPPALEILSSRQFAPWLRENKLSLGITTYQTGQFYLIGTENNNNLSVFNRVFPRCMGLCRSLDSRTLYLSSLYQIWRLEATKEVYQQGFDRTYIPQVAYTTGDIDTHDMVITHDNQLVFVNTLFSCLSTLSETNNFEVFWRPEFISKLAPEDRCHLNGLTLRDGKPRYVTCVAQTDLADGWRSHRKGGGVAIDIENNTVVCSGLTMPHSPRWHDDKLWLLEAGTGQFGYVTDQGTFEPIAFCPGFLRGLSFYDHYAFLTTSLPRGDKTFTGLPLENTLREKNSEARCGVYVVDTRTGNIVHHLQFEGQVKELFDVIVIPNTQRPQAIGLKSDEIRWVLQLPSTNIAPTVTEYPSQIN